MRRQKEVPLHPCWMWRSVAVWSPMFRDNLVVSTLKSTCPVKSWTWLPVPSAPTPSRGKKIGGRKCTTCESRKDLQIKRCLMKCCHWLWFLSLSSSVLIYVTVLWFRHLLYHYSLKHTEQGKAIPLQAWTGPVGGWGCQNFSTVGTREKQIVSPTHLPPLPLSRYPWYAIQLEAESTPGP